MFKAPVMSTLQRLLARIMAPYSPNPPSGRGSMIDFRDVRDREALEQYVSAFLELPQAQRDVITEDMKRFLEEGQTELRLGVPLGRAIATELGKQPRRPRGRRPRTR